MKSTQLDIGGTKQFKSGSSSGGWWLSSCRVALVTAWKKTFQRPFCGIGKCRRKEIEEYSNT